MRCSIECARGSGGHGKSRSTKPQPRGCTAGSVVWKARGSGPRRPAWGVGPLAAPP
ncbi:Hypothetical protein A7982_04772 [Minicystis rosea]|nr:Hypothetical protein A7982_04772 [Minicystis rosea]